METYKTSEEQEYWNDIKSTLVNSKLFRVLISIWYCTYIFKGKSLKPGKVRFCYRLIVVAIAIIAMFGLLELNDMLVAKLNYLIWG